MRHLLEYEDHDIKDLLGDMEGIGQAIPVKASIWIQYSDLDNTYDAIKNITTDEFYATGDEDQDALAALQLIVDGKFDYTPMETSGSFPKSEIQAIAKDYLRDKYSYKKIYLKKGKSGNALDAFADDLGSESLALSREIGGPYDYSEDAESTFKVYIAPPSDPSHRKDEFYTIRKPINVIEYKTR
jgi:hypothetical protein